MTPEQTPPTDSAMSPWHGYRGQENPTPPLERPRGLTIAISRQAGARGSSIAQAVGKLLGWQVFPQEMLDFLTHDDEARRALLGDLPAEAVAWAKQQSESFQERRKLPIDHDGSAVARLIFALGARGETVLVGRGAGFLLPRATTLHVRIIASLESRTGYLAQWLRLTEEEARHEAAQRDQRRANFLATMIDHPWDEPTAYDLLLNSERLSLDTIAELIVQACRAKQVLLEKLSTPPSTSGEFPVA